jgi:kinesin family protein 18/19
MHLLQKGNRARTVEPTAANKTSSRSHALLSVTVQQTSVLQTQDKMKSRIKQGKLFMIDLAGSERASQTKVNTLPIRLELLPVFICKLYRFGHSET